jgi:hypothetical protein
MNLNQDEKFGLECEKLFMIKFPHLKKIKDEFNTFDFKYVNKKNKKYIYELKGRKYNFNSHLKDWQIGVNKIKRAKQYYEMGVNVYIYNMFYDGLYYWKYDPKRVDTDLYLKMGGRDDRNKNEKKLYYYIKSSCMKLSKKNVCSPNPLNKCLID